MASSTDDTKSAAYEAGLETEPKLSRFRFKKKDRPTDGDAKDQDRRRQRRDHNDRQHRRTRRKISPRPIDDPSTYDDSASGLPPHSAFRESLFDAMGDDEGAAFWEGVYGYPIHTFPNTYSNEQTGELEQMNDDEFAQFVRKKLWEKSWDGIEAARQVKSREREQEKRRIREDDTTKSHRQTSKSDPDYLPRTDILFDLDVEESLRRGKRRRERKRWKALWNDYLQKWDDLRTLRELESSSKEQVSLRNKIAWPVETGERKDVNSDEIERFITRCTEAIESEDVALVSILKSERVRWHPDKIQQRYGFMGIDEGTMQGVTAVFQTIDRMWNDCRHQG